MVTIPTVYYQTTTDIYGERNMDARSIGLLDPTRTILNLQSALSSTTDRSDIYRFRMTKDGPIGLSITAFNKDGAMQGAGATKVELLNRGGQVIADSTAKSGGKKDAWDQVVATNFEGKTGDYYVRITRGPDSSSNAILKYNMQVRSSFDARDDFTTIEKPATSAAQIYGANGTVTTLAGNLKTAMTPYSKESDSQKLLSAISPTFA